MPRFASCAALLLCLGLAGPALAGPPAAIPDASTERANLAFEDFSQGWMKKMAGLESANRRSPKVRGSQYTYRGYDAAFRTELKPTGHSSAPYVGVLRYREHLYTCLSAQAKNCSIAATTPVTEIFRFQNGRWVY